MDKLTPARRSDNMRRIRATDTAPEKLLRSLLHKNGYRFRLHAKDLPGRPDLVFRRRRKVIFVHGCFWHQHEGCIDCHTPKTGVSYWEPKLNRNKLRDLEHQDRLAHLGWESLVVWECEMKDAGAVLQKVLEFLGPAKAALTDDEQPPESPPAPKALAAKAGA